LNDTTPNRNLKLSLEPKDYIVFHLAHFAPDGFSDNWHKQISLYNQIKRGWKTQEVRRVKNDFEDYWIKRLFKPLSEDVKAYIRICGLGSIGCKLIVETLRYKKAWFVEGYPKGNLPHLEVNLTGIWVWCKTGSKELTELRICFENVKEVS
jgi:transcription-repair coupling factor (superfamily II helicase)